MLTMGEPIQLKSARPVGMLGGLFDERIRGNHKQMQAHLDPAEMLHFLSAPPELYIEKVRMAPLVNQQNRTEMQNVELYLVNNMLNRILVSEHMEFTYQDRVFVENILRKLGVTNVRRFMRQVQMVKEETRNVRELLALYESGRDTVRLIQEYRREHPKKRGKEDAGEEAGAAEAACRFSTSVLNRLHTEDIYRELNNYAVYNVSNRMMLDRREMAFGEQNITAAYLSLNGYRNRIFAQGQNFVYNRLNIYEAGDESHTEETYRQIVGNILQATLLNVMSQIFHIRYKQLTQHTGWWHEFTDALHVFARNTFQRFESLHNRMSFTAQDKEEYHRMVQHFERQEIHVLKNFLAKRVEVEVGAPRFTKLAQETLQNRTEFWEAYEGDTNIDAMWQEVTQLKENLPQEPEGLRMEREKEIKRQLDTINRQNIERMERLSEYTNQAEEPKERQIDREMARADALRALTESEQVMLEYLERRPGRLAEREQEREKLREILGDETVRVFETIRDYWETPGRYPNVAASEGQTMNLLMQDIAAAEKALALMPAHNTFQKFGSLHNLPQEPEGLRMEREKEIKRQLDTINRQNIERMERLSEYTNQAEEPKERQIDREMARADAPRMLTESEQVMLEYLERRPGCLAERGQEREKLREILGDETVRVFETIRDYRETPGRYPNVAASEGQAMNLLMQDIAAAEKTLAHMSAPEPGMIVYDEVQREATKEVERVLRETIRDAKTQGHRQEGTLGNTAEAVELLYRQGEQSLNEETLQALMQERRRDSQIRNIETREVVSGENQVAEIVRSKVNEMKLKQDEEIGRIISQNVRRQLDMLSEQVYGKLERRMDAERRRRGM